MSRWLALAGMLVLMLSVAYAVRQNNEASKELANGLSQEAPPTWTKEPAMTREPIEEITTIMDGNRITFADDSKINNCPIVTVERSGTVVDRVLIDIECYRSTLLDQPALPKDDVSPCHVVTVRPEGDMIDDLIVDLKCYRRDLETRL